MKYKKCNWCEERTTKSLSDFHESGWNAVSFDVELDLAEDNEKTPRLQAVRLLFARGLKEPVETDADKKDW